MAPGRRLRAWHTREYTIRLPDIRRRCYTAPPPNSHERRTQRTRCSRSNAPPLVLLCFCPSSAPFSSRSAASAHAAISSICQVVPDCTNLTVALILLVPNWGLLTVNKRVSCAVVPVMVRKPPLPKSEQSEEVPHVDKTFGTS